ncbi:sulfite exporter TauE/SafE family protein [Agrococcus sp. ARC_14]|uniref:sulfite exporter TauE/SafE family protein n=1 Tax=Agrococcus sp. ARC_14 TaxID=2919927 RepID=UPI001F068A22|nr:sulfite exporter TauE/SafE family protein [Agrococcus sp. ARC_14]MCH1882139.1 sulfite exporter TauE/SafE family protein [Agrococcus sp. ARC_14]
MEPGGFLLIALASMGAGAINAAAGGGTLITFPAMLAAGMTPLAANITSSVGLLAGSLGGAWSYRAELRSRRRRFLANAPFAAVGGLVGAALLLLTPSDSFTAIVPWLVLTAACLFALQPLVTRIVRRNAEGEPDPEATGGWPVRLAFLAIGVYGSYFGAGIGVMMLAVLGVVIHDSLQHHNALKNLTALVVNGSGVLILAFSPLVHWGVVAIMLAGSLVGGVAGGWLSRRVPSWALRALVIGFALWVGLSMLLG